MVFSRGSSENGLRQITASKKIEHYTPEGEVCLNDNDMRTEIELPVRRLIVDGKYEIRGRGTVYTLDLEVNGIGCLRKEFRETLMGQKVMIDDQLYIVKGIEAFATFDNYVHKHIGILVKNISEKT